MRLDATELKNRVSFIDTCQKLGYDYKNGYSNICPCCEKRKLSINEKESFAYCFLSGCEANRKIDIFQWLQLVDITSSFNESYNYICNLWNINSFQKGNTPKRSFLLERIFKEYNCIYDSKPFEYLLNRNIHKSLEVIPVGYSNSNTFLQDKGFTLKEIESCGILSESHRELFYNHLIFPIFDRLGNIKHLQGRALDANSYLRWINTKGEGKQTINYYLFNENNIDSSEVYLTEGISDGLSLIELVGHNKVISCFGTSPKLSTHRKLFSSINKLIAIFDNDRFDPSKDENEKLKSWKNILPRLIELKIHYPSLKILCLMPPQKSGIKDINDWYNKGNLTEKVLNNKVISESLNLFDFVFTYFPYEEIHNSLLTYIQKDNSNIEVKSKLETLIREETSIVDYIIRNSNKLGN